jgi:hypothetical protein
MRVNGTSSTHGATPGDEPAADDAAAPAKAAKQSAASASDPTGLGWRAKMTGQASAAAAPAESGSAKWVDAAKAEVEKALGDAGGSPKHLPLKSVPAAVKAAVESYQKGDDKAGQGDKAFAWKTSYKGETLYVAQEAEQGAYMLTAFDAKGKKIAEGEVNSDEDLGINW